MERLITRVLAMITTLAAAGCYTGAAAIEDRSNGDSTGTIADDGSDAPATTDGSDPGDTTSSGRDSTAGGTSDDSSTSDDGVTDDASSSDGGDDGPMVDVSDPQLYMFSFPANEADPEATLALGTQLAYLDTRVPLRGELAVYLHGSGTPDVCGGGPMGEVLASMGFHVIMPCYVSDYGVENCGDDIAGCRLEAFEGVDHHSFIDITPPNSIERRVARALAYVQTLHPGGDWQWFADGDTPRWDATVISGISHGGSSSGVIGQVRSTIRVVMLSAPFDSGQAWLFASGLTPVDRYFGFSHTGDEQHAGHLEGFAELGLPGAPTVVGLVGPPFAGSHRLVTSAQTPDPHSSTQAGDTSPQMDGEWVFMPVWRAMYLGG
ncbi:MAG TPA: hypothetical protein VFG69_06095 [Nannocystaceae bacterium]|nr:hypothetical protein [Nannocystaceae bacterium]